MANGDTKTESYLRVAAEGTRADLPSDTCCNTKTQNLILGVANRIMDVEDEVEELKNNPDVVNIVDTYQDLQNYDTSTLTDKDIIRVLEDSTHSNSSTYYRWNATTNQFDYIGEAGGGGPTVVQTTGNSTTDVMSQKAAFGMIVADTSSTIPYARIQIGGASKSDSVAIGQNSLANSYSVSVGKGAGIGSNSSAAYNTDIGYSAGTNKGSTVSYSVSLGSHSKATRAGEVNIGTSTTTHGYNSTSYRVLGGVHDGQDAHDATTVGQVNTRLGGLTLLPITQAAYDALATKDANTLYVITGA